MSNGFKESEKRSNSVHPEVNSNQNDLVFMPKDLKISFGYNRENYNISELIKSKKRISSHIFNNSKMAQNGERTNSSKLDAKHINDRFIEIKKKYNNQRYSSMRFQNFQQSKKKSEVPNHNNNSNDSIKIDYKKQIIEIESKCKLKEESIKNLKSEIDKTKEELDYSNFRILDLNENYKKVEGDKSKLLKIKEQLLINITETPGENQLTHQTKKEEIGLGPSELGFSAKYDSKIKKSIENNKIILQNLINENRQLDIMIQLTLTENPTLQQSMEKLKLVESCDNKESKETRKSNTKFNCVEDLLSYTNKELSESTSIKIKLIQEVEILKNDIALKNQEIEFLLHQNENPFEITNKKENEKDNVNLISNELNKKMNQENLYKEQLICQRKPDRRIITYNNLENKDIQIKKMTEEIDSLKDAKKSKSKQFTSIISENHGLIKSIQEIKDSRNKEPKGTKKSRIKDEISSLESQLEKLKRGLIEKNDTIIEKQETFQQMITVLKREKEKLEIEIETLLQNKRPTPTKISSIDLEIEDHKEKEICKFKIKLIDANKEVEKYKSSETVSSEQLNKELIEFQKKNQNLEKSLKENDNLIGSLTNKWNESKNNLLKEIEELNLEIAHIKAKKFIVSQAIEELQLLQFKQKSMSKIKNKKH